MKIKFLIIVLLISFAALIAQQKEGAKMQKADESGFIDVDKVPALISQLKPLYPEQAKLAGIEGKVFLKLLIDEKGNVAKAKVEKGVKDILDNAALEAAKKAKFSPAMAKNKPVKVWVVLPIAFKLDTGKKEPLIVSPGIKAPTNLEKAPDPNEKVEIDKYPEALELGKPVYPDEAKKNGIEGKVFVKILIDSEGKVADAIIAKSDNDIFNQAALDAAKQSKFTIPMKDGKSFPIWIVLPYKFALKEKADKK